MKVLICGTRTWNDQRPVWRVLDDLYEANPDLEVIHGAAKGADSIAGQIATSFGIPVTAVPADWEKFGKSAGPMRNKEMLGMAPDLVVAFRRDGESRGTDHMIRIARRAGVPVRVVTENGKSYDLPA